MPRRPSRGRAPLAGVAHGTDGGYGRGCSCDACRRAHAEYQRAWRERRRGGPSGYRHWTEDEALAALRDWARREGRAPAHSDWRPAPDGCPGAWTLVEKFGSWSNALVAAGLEARPPGDSRPLDEIDAARAEVAALAARHLAGESLAALGREIGVRGQTLGRRIARWRASGGEDELPTLEFVA